LFVLFEVICAVAFFVPFKLHHSAGIVLVDRFASLHTEHFAILFVEFS